MEKGALTFPQILLENAQRYGDSKAAIQKKDYGIWQCYSKKKGF